MFSTQSVTQIIISITFKMLSANAFKVDWSQTLSFGKELQDLSKLKALADDKCD